MHKLILKRGLMIVGGIALALITLEGLVRLGYWAVLRHRFPTEKYREAVLEQVGAGEAPRAPRGEFEAGRTKDVIHPYLGFVPDPSAARNGGTVGDPSQVVTPSDSELIVGIFGGSFAAGLCNFAEGELRRVLAQPGKAVRLLCVAAGGYKQPQQFLSLAYLLAQGAHFDLVINVDGFNEIALSPAENRPRGVAPLYPSRWFWRAGDVNDIATLKLVAAIAALDHERADWARRFAQWELYRSSLMALAWESGDRLFGARWYRLITELNQHKIEARQSYGATGPPMTFADDQAYYAYLARLWRDSSLQMKLLCDANGIAYAHFLQPNQHVEASKALTAEERRRLMGVASYPASVALGYPLLREQGAELARAGVKFHDLTLVFKDVQDTVYSDGCCHLTGPGYVMVADAIGESIRTDIASPDQAANGAGSKNR